MSQDKTNKQTQRSTVTTTTTQTQPAQSDPDMGVLTPQEEKVIRMLHGLSEKDTHQLKFALGANEEARANLAQLEYYLMQLFKADQLDDTIMDDIQTLKQSLVN